MHLNILTTPAGQIGLVALFIIAIVVAAKLMNKAAKKRRKKSRTKL